MSVCCEQEQVNNSDSDEGLPRRVYVPVRSSAPTPVASAKKVKVNPGHVSEARARAIELCKTPEEFVQKIVYEGVSAEHVQFATQLQDTWSNLVANNTRGSQRIPVGWGRRMRGVQEEVAQVLCLCR
jgi:hypothetical protein